MIHSLEADDYEALPDQVFVVGYIQKYARLVELDPAPLVAAYRMAAPQAEPARFGNRPRTNRQIGSGHLVVRLVSIGILILLATLTFLWWQDRQPGPALEMEDLAAEQETGTTTRPEPAPALNTGSIAGADPTEVHTDSQPPETGSPPQATQPEPLPATAATGQQQTAVASNAATMDDSAGENAANGRILAPESGSTARAQNTKDQEAAPEDDGEASEKFREIVMSFDGPCWVDVRDREHKYKLFGEMKKGDRHIMAGEPPYSVILGNAAAVRITVGGEAFDLSPETQGNVARFTLDPDETP